MREVGGREGDKTGVRETGGEGKRGRREPERNGGRQGRKGRREVLYSSTARDPASIDETKVTEGPIAAIKTRRQVKMKIITKKET